VTHEGREIEEGVQLAGFRIFIAGEEECLEAGCGCAGGIQGRAIADVKNFAGSQCKLLGGLMEDGR